MKCPYCKIHYMDDERECPICGKPNPARWSAKQRAAQKQSSAKTTEKYPSIRHRSSSRKSTAKQKTSSPWSSKTTATPSSTTTSASSKKNQSKQKSARLGAIVSVAVVLISLIPTGISALQDVLEDVDFSSIVEQFQPQPEYEEDISPVPDYTPPASAYDQIGGEWVGMDDAGYLALDLDSLDYSYSPDNTQNLEHGYALVYEVDQYQDDSGAVQYSYQVDFYPNWSDYGYSMYLTGTDSDPDVLGTILYDQNQSLDIDNMVIWKRVAPQNA